MFFCRFDSFGQHLEYQEMGQNRAVIELVDLTTACFRVTKPYPGTIVVHCPGVYKGAEANYTHPTIQTES